MADNDSQPGTSTGSGNTINNTISGNEIGSLIQTIYATFHQSTSSTSSTHAPKRNPINNIELAVDTFIGRKTELSDIMQLFHESQVVVIAAMGGMGKTQLARKFACVNADVYRDRYWINAETEEQLLKSFDRLAKKVKVDANTDIETVRDTYRSFTEGAALLIFDNVEHVDKVYKYLPTRIQLEDITLHVLVTSRWTEWASDPLIKCYPLQPLDISVSLQLFQRKFGQTCIEIMQDKWEELARMLGYLPLALQVATSYIYKRTKHNSDLRTVLTDYVEQLEEGATGLLNDPLTEYDNRSVYVSMMLTLEQLENKADSVPNVPDGVQWKLAVKLINASAYMDPDFIRKKCLLQLVDNRNLCILDEALILLKKFSLFNQGVDWMGNKHYTVHRLIQSGIRYNQTVKGTGDKYYTDAVKCPLTNDGCYHWVEFQYANERVSAIVGYYKENPSPKLLRTLVECKAIAVVENIFELMTDNKNQIQSLIVQEDLLVSAVYEEDLSMVQLLCRNGANINQLCRNSGLPPLHLAISIGNMEIAKWLLQNGAMITVRDKEGRKALHAASRYANHKMVSDIIQIDRAAVHATDNEGNTPLHTIESENKEKDILATINVLLENNADITKRNKLGDTVLHSIARSVCAAAVSLILQLNKDLINSVNKNGQTALHVISYKGSNIDESILSIMRVLIENGVDFSKVDSRGNTVLHSAAQGVRAEAVSLILQVNKDLINIVNEDGETALHVISYDSGYIDDEGILSTIRVLIDNGVDFSKVDSRGNTVLHSAARGARVAAVSLFLKLNKDLINIVNDDGKTALHVISYDHRFLDDECILSTIRVLIDNGVDFSKVDSQGNTVLHYAAQDARAAAVSLILQLNKDLIDIVNKDGKTALHVIPYDDTDIDDECILSTIRALIDNGVDFSKVDSWGNTVLHYAAQGARAESVSLILQVNKDLINIVNVDGDTALHVIGNCFNSEYKDLSEEEREELFACIKEIARVLIMNGLSLNTSDKKGRTPLDTVLPAFKDILLQVAEESNNQLMESPVKRQRTE